MGLTLSGQEIKNLAEYCGFKIVPESIEQDFLEGDFYIEKCPTGGVAGDDGVAKMYGHVVTCDGCEGGECMPLGESTGMPELGTKMERNDTNSAIAAINYALELGAGDCGLEFLRAWNEGEFDAIRNEWPDAPEAVFIGADPLQGKSHVTFLHHPDGSVSGHGESHL